MKARANIKVHTEDDFRDSQIYQVAKAEILQYIKTNQTVTINDLNSQFSSYIDNLFNILSDLQEEIQIKFNQGNLSKITYIGNLRRNIKSSLDRHQNNQNVPKRTQDLRITGQKILPDYYGRKRAY